jgi:hypothetical protein
MSVEPLEEGQMLPLASSNCRQDKFEQGHLTAKFGFGNRRTSTGSQTGWIGQKWTRTRQYMGIGFPLYGV